MRSPNSVGAQEPQSVDQLILFAGRRIMFGETEQVKQKLEKMLTSDDTEWVNAVIVTLNAMYTQFELERQGDKNTIPFGACRILQPQIGRFCNRRPQDRTQLGFALLIFRKNNSGTDT
jgi:hypothetical protein